MDTKKRRVVCTVLSAVPKKEMNDAKVYEAQVRACLLTHGRGTRMTRGLE